MDKYHRSNPPTELKSVVMGRENSRKKSSISSACSGHDYSELIERLESMAARASEEEGREVTVQELVDRINRAGRQMVERMNQTFGQND